VRGWANLRYRSGPTYSIEITGTFAALERDEINARELYLLLEGIEVVRERRRYTRLPINI
jgi:hypothetical protein